MCVLNGCVLGDVCVDMMYVLICMSHPTWVGFSVIDSLSLQP